MPHRDHVFVVGVSAPTDELLTEYIDKIENEIMEWYFVTDIMAYDPTEEEPTDVDRKA